MPNEEANPIIEEFVDDFYKFSRECGLNDIQTIELFGLLLQLGEAQKFKYLQTRYGTHAGSDCPN